MLNLEDLALENNQWLNGFSCCREIVFRLDIIYNLFRHPPWHHIASAASDSQHKKSPRKPDMVLWTKGDLMIVYAMPLESHHTG
jgi:hypothetical protein